MLQSVLLFGMLVYIGQLNTTIGRLSNAKPTQTSLVLTIPPDLANGSATQPQRIDAVLTLPSGIAQTPSAGALPYLAAILAGFFTLTGSGLVLVANHAASKATREFEWGKHFWNTYQESYLGLRNLIRSTTDSTMIESRLATLNEKVVLPPKLERELLQLVDDLKHERVEAKRVERRDTFLSTFQDYVSRPWDYLR
jgi:hypothetical protein